MSVETYNTIDIRNISVNKKISHFSESYRHYIKYKKKESLLIQTPRLTLLYGITTCGFNKYIDFNLFSHDKEINLFQKKIKKINNYIIRRINKDLDKKIYIDNFKLSETKNERIRFFLSNDTLFFDENKQKIYENTIKASNHVKLIITPVYLWYNNTIYGIRWEILQLKQYICVPVLTTYSFIDSPSAPPPPPPPPPLPLATPPSEYIPFLDLIKRGVPKQAVKNKLMTLNMDPTILDKSYSQINIKLNNTSKNKLMDEIKKGNFKLQTSTQQKNITPTYEAPTLEEIRLKLNNLKKI